MAALPAIILAVLLYKGRLNDGIDAFLKGASHPNLILMFMVFMLAGAFASVSSAIGSVDATVQLGLSIISPEYVLPMLFIISAFVATAMGTSMGTIAACAPIAFGFTQATDIDAVYAIGAVVGGAMFGDNLSMISDTTIAATTSLKVQLRDKFRVNVWIAVPASIVSLLLYMNISHGSQAIQFKDYAFNDSIWVDIDQVYERLPFVNKENVTKYIDTGISYQYVDSTSVWLVKVKDMVHKNEVVPLSYILPTIKQIILNKRKTDLINKIQTEITNDAIKDNDFEIFK